MDRQLVVATLAVALLGSLALAAVPSYIKICGRRNPKLEECIIDSVQSLTPKLKNGIPELKVPPLEPLFIDEIALANLSDFRAVAFNVKLSGLSTFKIKHLKVNLEKQLIDIDVVFARISMESDYDVKARIIVPISEKGPISTVTDNVQARVQMRFQRVKHRGLNYVYWPSMTVKVNIPDYTAKFMPGAKSTPVTQAINSVLQNSRKEIIESMTPNIEQAISKKVLEVANNISKSFTYEELFPDTE